MLRVEMRLKDGEGDRSPACGASTAAMLWAHWPWSGFGVEPLGLPASCEVWGSLLCLSWLRAAASGCTSWFGLGPEAAGILNAILLRVKSGGEGEVEGKG